MLTSASTGVLGLFVHLVFLLSIFDIYFKSPIIHGLPSYSVPMQPPANRVVLFLADGLRADRAFELQEDGQPRTPFLRSVVTEKGSWGVSHTRVPTESRPGHVAILAGFYEDVSAVTKGWKENPVEFDSVFNQSRNVWAWGSPDIINIFFKGDSARNAFVETYDPNEIDFASEDASKLDTWVFDRVQNFLTEARVNATLKNLLFQDKTIIFLHLLGLDTTGHGHNPDSREYYENIRLVDEGIRKVVNEFEDFFEYDGKTAYIMTSDHGMTDWGNHGAGNPSETETPLVAWGAGLGLPKGAGKDHYYDGYSEAWNLSLIRRVDVNQADICPLLAVLIGIHLPVNSVGILPVEYLGTDWHFKAMALLTNARQILTQYKKQRLMVQETTFSIFFRQFKGLMPKRQVELTEMIETLLKQARYKEAIQVTQKFIELSLEGLTYYQKYDRFALSLAISLGFIGWMAFIVLILLKNYTGLMHKSLESQSRSLCPSWHDKLKIVIFSSLIFCLSTFVLYIQNAPIVYYLYFLIPLFLWILVIYWLDIYSEARIYLRRGDARLRFFCLSFLAFLGLEVLVVAFFRRGILSAGLFFIGLWPFTTSLTKKICFGWLGACLMLSIYPLLPVIGNHHNYTLVTLTGWISILIFGYCARRPELGLVRNSRQVAKEPQRVVIITVIQVILIWVSITVVRSTAGSIERKEGLPLLNQIVAWLILISSPVIPLFSTTCMFTRLHNLALGLLVPYLLMCIFYEGMFLITLCFVMFLWIYIEHQVSGSLIRLQDMSFDHSLTSHSSQYQLRVDDIRRAYFFVFFMVVAFYGTGNIASLNSFSISSFYCFLTVFSPFVMGLILLTKVLIPFLVVCCAFRALLQSVSVSNTALFLLVLLMSDFMALHFFFMIKDSGSWLEIGMSISHYLLAMGFSIFVVLFHGAAWFLTTFCIDISGHRFKRHLL